MKKKKNYIYLIAPIIALVVFAAVYINFARGLEKREADRVAREKKKKEDKLLQQARDNEKAIKEANAASARRKAEREAKEAKDKADKDARALAIEARDKADRDQRKLAAQVERLEKDVQTEKDAIAKLEIEKKKSMDEVAFLKNYVKQAEDNAKALNQVLDKIAAADAARIQAEAEAARAAKKNS